jgi:SPP1 family predicted phage head-tail adaptor
MKYNKNEVTGKMRDRIILQNVTRVRSLSGFASESWADIATIWAFAESKLPGSNETIIDGKNTAKNVSDFTIRYISSISEESRIVWGDKLYQVKNLKVSHDRRFISFTGVFYDSYILTGVNVAASVNGIATTSANLKLIMSVIGQANAIASSFADLTVFQQGTVDVAASVNALGTATANLTKVININSSVDANANISAPITISKNIQSNVDALATSSANVQLIKLLSASVDASATATSILDVVTQGVALVDASVTATGETTANLTRIVTLESSSTTAAETSATAILTKVLEASATASAETNAAAQITIPVNASATATSETSAAAQLTYTVNASADATALTSAEAQIVRIISASATAMAESSAEASFGVTFVASVNGTATVTNATIARTATLAATVTGAATVTNANIQLFDPNFANVSILLHGTGTNGQTTFTDSSQNNLTLTRSGNTIISTSRFKFNSSSIYFAQTATDLINITNSGSIFQFPANFTIETFINSDTITLDKSIFVISNTGITQYLAFNFDGTNFNIYLNSTTPTVISHGMSADTWHHVAMVRNGSTITLYTDGVSRGTITNSSTLGYAAGNISLNRLGGGLNDAMYLDEFRITKGVARYTTGFTPPSREFLNQ